MDSVRSSMKHLRIIAGWLGCILAGFSASAQSNLAAHSVGEIVTNMVQHAQTGDTNYFIAVLDSSATGKASQLIGMIQRSGMLTNYPSRLESQSPAEVRLNYHYLERGCHFQIDLQKQDTVWKVTRIWFCR
jgi:hypothetical protein